jgi:hypothetical protein
VCATPCEKTEDHLVTYVTGFARQMLRWSDASLVRCFSRQMQRFSHDANEGWHSLENVWVNYSCMSLFVLHMSVSYRILPIACYSTRHLGRWVDVIIWSMPLHLASSFLLIKSFSSRTRTSVDVSIAFSTHVTNIIVMWHWTSNVSYKASYLVTNFNKVWWGRGVKSDSRAQGNKNSE